MSDTFQHFRQRVKHGWKPFAELWAENPPPQPESIAAKSHWLLIVPPLQEKPAPPAQKPRGNRTSPSDRAAMLELGSAIVQDFKQEDTNFKAAIITMFGYLILGNFPHKIVTILHDLKLHITGTVNQSINRTAEAYHVKKWIQRGLKYGVFTPEGRLCVEWMEPPIESMSVGMTLDALVLLGKFSRDSTKSPLAYRNLQA